MASLKAGPDFAFAPVPLLGRGLFRVLSPGGNRGLTILIFHRVLATKDALFPAEVDRAEFSRQIGMLAESFKVLPLIDAVRHLGEGSLPPRAACITFDDGYADNADVALPVLQEHGLNATFFVATGFLDGGRMWNDTLIELVRRTPGPHLDASCIGMGIHAVASLEQRQAAIRALIGHLKYVPMDERRERVGRLVDVSGIALPQDLMMRSDQVRQLHRAGMGIGGHTVNHPILARLPAAEARREILEGKNALEEIISAPVPLFAYPNGKPGEDYNAEHVAMVRELGFEGAVSTSWGACRNGTDVFQLPRFTPWDRSALRFNLRLARNLSFQAALA